MATQKQKDAARRNLVHAREAQHRRAKGEHVPRSGAGLSTHEENQLDDATFAFPKERKEPLNDAAHVRNAIARFDQVEDVTDAERDEAWGRITRAARKYGVEVSERGWRELFEGGRSRKP
jgi:hypothetical protein